MICSLKKRSFCNVGAKKNRDSLEVNQEKKVADKQKYLVVYGRGGGKVVEIPRVLK